MKASRIALLLVAAVVVFLIVSPGTWRRSEAERVREQLLLLARLVSKNTDEGASSMAIKAQRLDGVFADTCRLSVSDSQINGKLTREELISTILRVRGAFVSLELKFQNIEILVSDDQATAIFTARLTGKGQSGHDADETRKVEATAARIDGSWRLSAFDDAPPK